MPATACEPTHVVVDRIEKDQTCVRRVHEGEQECHDGQDPRCDFPWYFAEQLGILKNCQEALHEREGRVYTEQKEHEEEQTDPVRASGCRRNTR